MGRWRVGLCASCHLCSGLWWMGCCCPSILMGQGMQRLGLDPLGGRREPATNQNSTCTIVTVLTIICALIYILRLPFLIFMLIFGTRYRSYMRKKYNIPTQYFGCCEDFCCVFWCAWCMACQTHRQTHDDTQYKYNCCSDTGLDDNAPSVV